MSILSGKKFISPGAWFSMVYPTEWSEFENSESTFLFYNPVNWTGNFRISAYKKDAKSVDAQYYGRYMVEQELKDNPSAVITKIGKYGCAYSKEMFLEQEQYYVSHFWVVDGDSLAFECSFTVPKGGDVTPAEKIIESLDIRIDGQKYPAELIPIRVSEISTVNEAYEWTVATIKKELKKDFQGTETDLPKLQAIIDSGVVAPKQRDAWLAFGITLCVILTNEIEGFEWHTLMDGNREAPVLVYNRTETMIDPMRLVWSKIKAGEACDIVAEYKEIIGSL